jgi:hypothetical protein
MLINYKCIFLNWHENTFVYHVTCSHIFQSDFHFEYTECDSKGGRWRVQVPKPNTCEGGAPRPPIRGKSCGKYS